jgi:catechol 2,3-dioxygenase-like lactoylglutathione lyase family enzyme
VKVRPIHFVADVQEALRFYHVLGLRTTASSRSGHWIELEADGGELGLHDSAIAADGQGRRGLALNFIAEEPLQDIEQRLLAAGFVPEGTIVDHEWGRALQVKAPDGTVVQIDERDRELYT